MKLGGLKLPQGMWRTAGIAVLLACLCPPAAVVNDDGEVLRTELAIVPDASGLATVPVELPSD